MGVKISGGNFLGGRRIFQRGVWWVRIFPGRIFLEPIYLRVSLETSLLWLVSFLILGQLIKRGEGGGVGITMRMLLVCFSKKNLVACGGMYSKIEISPSLELLELRNIYLHIFGLFHFVSIYWESILVLSGIEKLLRCWGERMLF